MKKLFIGIACVLCLGLASCGNAKYETVYEKIQKGDLKFTQEEYSTMIEYLSKNIEEANRFHMSKDPTAELKFKRDCPYFETFMSEITIADHQHKLDKANIQKMQYVFDELN